MPIVIKEVIVKTTVERTAPQWSQLPDVQIVEQVKRLVLEKLSNVEHTSRAKRFLRLNQTNFRESVVKRCKYYF